MQIIIYDNYGNWKELIQNVIEILYDNDESKLYYMTYRPEEEKAIIEKKEILCKYFKIK